MIKRGECTESAETEPGALARYLVVQEMGGMMNLNQTRENLTDVHAEKVFRLGNERNHNNTFGRDLKLKFARDNRQTSQFSHGAIVDNKPPPPLKNQSWMLKRYLDPLSTWGCPYTSLDPIPLNPKDILTL